MIDLRVMIALMELTFQKFKFSNFLTVCFQTDHYEVKTPDHSQHGV